MIFQFTTGSVKDRQQNSVHITILNVGIQAANVAHVFKKNRDRSLLEVVEGRSKIMPQEEVTILSEIALKDVQCEITLKIDSPSLIVTIVGETQFPLHFHTLFVEDIDTDEERSPPTRSISLLWGYINKGDPF